MGDLVGSRVTFSGPPLRLAASAAQSVGMALHELATNAVKYGALSDDSGTVAVEWGIAGDGVQPRFVMSWLERGGPPVAAPRRQGFGQRVIARSIEHALDATVFLDYASSGLNWRMEAPAAAVLENAGGPAALSGTGEVR